MVAVALTNYFAVTSNHIGNALSKLVLASMRQVRGLAIIL